MWCAAFSFYVEEHVAVHLATPLDQVSTHGRLLCTAFIVALLLPASLAPRGWRLHIISVPAAIFFLFEMLLGARILMASISRTAAAKITLVVYPHDLCPSWHGVCQAVDAQDWEDAHKVVRCIALTACVYIAGCCYQLVINSSAIVRGHRLMGTSGNPQWAAMLIGMALPAACYLVARASEPIAWRVTLAAFVALMIIMLLWTGSRTGILIATSGILFSFWSRLGRFLAVGLLIGLFVLLALQIYNESTASLTDMFTRGDTRSQVWSAMVDTFASNPAFGAMDNGYNVRENSYLAVAANMGLFGLVPLAAFIGATLWMLARLFRARKLLGSEKPFADVVIGSLLAILIGAGFEGYLLGTLTFPIFVIYIFLALASFALDAVTVAEHQASLPDGGMSAIQDDGGQPHLSPHGQFVEQYL